MGGNYNCPECGLAFAQASSMYRHISNKSCYKSRHKPKRDTHFTGLPPLEDMWKELVELRGLKTKFETLENAFAKLMQQDTCSVAQDTTIMGKNNTVNNNNIQSTKVTNANNTNTSTTNNTVIIQAFTGTEDYSHLSHGYLTQCVKKLGPGVTDLIKGIHFNPKQPHLSNVRAKGIKSTTDKKVLETHNGNKWVLSDRDQTILKLFVDKFNILDGHFCDNEEEIKASVGDTRYEVIDAWLQKARNGDKKITKEVTKDILLLLLNHAISNKV